MNTKRTTATARSGQNTSVKNASGLKTSGARAKPADTNGASDCPLLDLDRYVPGFITFIANKFSRSTTALYQQRFGVNVTEWRIMSLLAIEPGIAAARICQIIGFDKGPVSRTLTALQERKLITIKADPLDGRSHTIRLTAKGQRTHDQIIVAAREREQQLLLGLNKGERETLISLLRRVHSNIDAAEAG